MDLTSLRLCATSNNIYTSNSNVNYSNHKSSRKYTNNNVNYRNHNRRRKDTSSNNINMSNNNINYSNSSSSNKYTSNKYTRNKYTRNNNINYSKYTTSINNSDYQANNNHWHEFMGNNLNPETPKL